MKVELVALQMSSVPDVEANLAWVESQLTNANLSANSLVVLPECFSFFGGNAVPYHSLAEPLKGGVIAQRLARLAKQNQCWLFAGTMPTVSQDPKRYGATCRCFSPQGEQIATYDKIHLFDVSVADNTGSYQESATTVPGSQITVITVGEIRVGVAVCYDIRFPALFDAMGEIDVLVLPAAFTHKTGSAHWEVLLRARAIENQCYIVAANQVGTHKCGRQTYGHSMVVSPWGEILAEKGVVTGVVSATADSSYCQQLRKAMPIQQHKKFRSHFVKSS